MDDEISYLALENYLTRLKTDSLQLEQIEVVIAGIYNSFTKSGIFKL